MKLPDWVVLHVPHDATCIPAAVREQFVLDDAGLANEIEYLTDHGTLALFGGAAAQPSRIVRAAVSRIVVDVERLVDDEREPMAGRGMGVVYTLTHDGHPLRRPLTVAERRALLRKHYKPHHARLEAVVREVLVQHGRCLVLDCHSFPDRPLPYEGWLEGDPRPEIGIGTDAFHTDAKLTAAFAASFQRAGWTVGIDRPFTGAMVPATRWRRDRRVAALMVEINRGLYLRAGARRVADFDDFAQRVQACCVRAVRAADAVLGARAGRVRRR